MSVFTELHADDPGADVTEIESLCFSCGENVRDDNNFHRKSYLLPWLLFSFNFREQLNCCSPRFLSTKKLF